MGDGRKCLGKPLKNQAPDLFHTWENRRNTCLTGFPTLDLILLFVHRCKALTSRCSLQILHSHTARGRLPHCVPHLVHMFYTTGENRDFQLLAIYNVITSAQLTDHDLLCFCNFCVNCSRVVCLSHYLPFCSPHTPLSWPQVSPAAPHTANSGTFHPHTQFSSCRPGGLSSACSSTGGNLT